MAFCTAPRLDRSRLRQQRPQRPGCVRVFHLSFSRLIREPGHQMPLTTHYLSQYNPFDGEPDEELFKQSWYFTKVGMIPALAVTVQDLMHRSVLGDMGLLFGRFVKINWPVLAIAYGGTALTAIIWNLRGKDNWNSKASPYFLGFGITAAAVFTKQWGCSMKGVASGVPIALLAAFAQTAREKNWSWIKYRRIHRKTSSHFGHTALKDLNMTSTYSQRFADPGRRPVF